MTFKTVKVLVLALIALALTVPMAAVAGEPDAIAKRWFADMQAKNYRFVEGLVSEKSWAGVAYKEDICLLAFFTKMGFPPRPDSVKPMLLLFADMTQKAAKEVGYNGQVGVIVVVHDSPRAVAHAHSLFTQKPGAKSMQVFVYADTSFPVLWIHTHAVFNGKTQLVALVHEGLKAIKALHGPI